VHATLPPSIVIHMIFSQCVTTQSVCNPPLLFVVLGTIFLFAHEPLLKLFSSCATIPHMCELLPMTSMSHIVPLCIYELLLVTFVSLSPLLPKSNPPQATSDSHVSAPRTLFILLVLSAHSARTTFAGQHQTLEGDEVPSLSFHQNFDITHRVNCDSSSGTYENLGIEVAHGPTIYISHTIPSAQMEMEWVHPFLHNLVGHNIHLSDSVLSDRWYTIRSHASPSS
jgi:hypothetical protein